MSETPTIRARVAEKLGWINRDPSTIGDRECGGTEFWIPPGETGAASYCNACRPDKMPPRYDLDWSATGPIIERLGIGLWRAADGWRARLPEYDNGVHLNAVRHGAPLLAVCALLLALPDEVVRG